MKSRHFHTLIATIIFLTLMVYIANLDKVVASLLLILAVLIQILIVVSEINNKT